MDVKYTFFAAYTLRGSYLGWKKATEKEMVKEGEGKRGRKGIKRVEGREGRDREGKERQQSIIRSRIVTYTLVILDPKPPRAARAAGYQGNRIHVRRYGGFVRHQTFHSFLTQ